MSNPAKVPVALADAAFRPLVFRDLMVDFVDAEVILLHPTLPRWAITNSTGLGLAQLLDGSRTLEEAALHLASQHGDGPLIEQIRRDVLDFALQLHESNMIENLPLAPEALQPRPLKIPDLTLYLTEECNLRCKHCAVVEGAMPQTRITREDCIKLIDDHIARYPGATVSFTGGEPLLHPHWLEILTHACSRTRTVNLATNGFMITDEMARQLAKLHAKIQISLDGADPEVHDFVRGKGAFDMAWAAIERLCAAGAAKKTLIATTLTRASLRQIEMLVERVDRMGLLELRLLTLNKLKAAETNWDRIVPDFEEMKRIYKYLLLDLRRRPRPGLPRIAASFPGYVPDADPNGGHWCPLGRTTIVDSQGVTYNCPTLRGPEWATGNIRRQNLEEIQTGERNAQLRNEMLQRQYVVEECRTCSWRNFCMGGCQAFTALRSGSQYINDEFCEFRRDLYRQTALLKVEHDTKAGRKIPTPA